MTPEHRAQLREFREACAAAYCQLFITQDEETAAVEKYRQELLRAETQEPASPQTRKE